MVVGCDERVTLVIPASMSYTHYKYDKYYSNLMNEPAHFYHIHVARREARISNGKLIYIEETDNYFKFLIL